MVFIEKKKGRTYQKLMIMVSEKIILILSAG